MQSTAHEALFLARVPKIGNSGAVQDGSAARAQAILVYSIVKFPAAQALGAVGMLGSNALSARGQSPERSGKDAARDLISEMQSGATMDVHTADQLLPYMAMATGESSFNVSRISRHLLSQMDTLESFLDVKFGVERTNDVYRFTVTPGAKR